MKMKGIADEFVKETEELMETGMNLFKSEELIMGLNPDTLGLMQKMIQLVKTSNELIRVQACIIDDMNQKLDKLMVRTEKEES